MPLMFPSTSNDIQRRHIGVLQDDVPIFCFGTPRML
jgi:hypothetical protein